ncbi:MAG: aspartate aminotransferase family protein [Bacteroidetes bacterium]|nr:aspartate aminotransferase family protein [Bacteroidota bacterium]
MNPRQIFQQHLAPTSFAPIGIHITRAEGATLWDAEGKEYIDLIGGISVANMGHRHPKVVAAIREQSEAYLHVMVYGEVLQSPQLHYAEMLAKQLPPGLDCVYFTNSGAEAVEGAIKLARRLSGRPNILAAHKSYHGSTTGALALLGDEYWRQAFRPLMPGILHHEYNTQAFLNAIDRHTAAVIIETVQAEAGVREPTQEWMTALREKCNDTGTLLILDEIQCGFGRTGKLWGFQHFGIVPDVVLLGKALGGGLPLGAFISSQKNMAALAENPVLGHISTFGGNPLCCAAGKAAFEALLEENGTLAVSKKEALFHQYLQHPSIKNVRSKGLLIAMELENDQAVLATLHRALKLGVFSDWFLFAPNCIRIAPPLNISETEIQKACQVLKECLG